MADVDANEVSQYTINPVTGQLAPKAPATVAAGRNSEAIAVTPDGKNLYVAVATVWQYTINPATGQLTAKSPATVAAPGSAHEIEISPDGKNAYVTVRNNTISQYRINPRTGALGSNPESAARTVLHPESVKLAADGQSAYVASENDGHLSQYTIDPATGKITPKSPATVPTASGSLGLAVTSG